MRVAVVDKETCNPKKCGEICERMCPINRKGDPCIVIGEKASIVEDLCIGCGICINVCPVNAINIVNTPEQLKESPIHRYGINEFVLYRLPIPVKGEVVGLLGQNGTGKTTALKILSGEAKPNLGEVGKDQKWDDVIKIFRGSELQDYLRKLEKREVRAVYKPQHVDKIPRAYKGSVSAFLSKIDERKAIPELLKRLDITHVEGRKMEELSGGELQRVAIAASLSKEGDIYYIDEPTSFLDVNQRLNVARLIREFSERKMVLVVEHDLAVLDYIADRVHLLYGVPGVYGIVSKPYGTRIGINTFLEGYVKEDNVRLRDKPIKFTVFAQSEKSSKQSPIIEFTDISKKLGDFRLEVSAGQINGNEVLGIFGANALGKTTFAKILAGAEKPDSGEVSSKITISYKAQYISASGYVNDILSSSGQNIYSEEYRAGIIVPFALERLLERDVKELSGGELQRVAIALCLSRKADCYLLDEPSAYLDAEQRLILAKTIRSFSETGKSVIVIDHDILFLDYIADRGMVFVGTPGKVGTALAPTHLRESFNRFLKGLGITFRRDPHSGRPRANKKDSQKDREQKAANEYYYTALEE
ncbi:MAG: ribosome biogenesis/translation initiation ATPase RLI [Candidatus Aenigmarchaeota archaeon]|nr:ribosome biogenesis/translation initiation ATPase RLI [Candidatus Aenigmarchaeota archaeon]